MSQDPLDKFLLLVGEISETLDLPDASPCGDDPRSPRWDLHLGGPHQLRLTCLSERQMVQISTTLGEPDSPAVYKTLLSVNALHEKTGGLRLSLAEPDGDIHLTAEVPLDELTLEGLTTIVLNFTETLVSYRELVQSELPEPEWEAEPTAIDPPGLRV